MRKVFKVIFLLLVLGGGILALYLAPGPASQPTTVIIPKGSSVKEMGEQLHKAGIILHPLPFVIAARITHTAPILKAGEYAFPAHISLEQVLDWLKNGRVVIRKLTVPEGLTSVQILALLQAEPALAGPPPFAVPPEGTLLPETYYFTYGDARGALLARMAENFRTTLAQLWAQRDPSLILKTPEEAVTLASIVEKETALPAERSRVAGVFLNRLKLHMLLQTDPTVIFAITKGHSVLERPLSYRDLQINSPYNTYLYPGLPPGPIAHPGRASLEAVLHPEHHDYLYFVADGTGGHAFARTLAEHNQNVIRWHNLSKKSTLQKENEGK